MDGRRAFEATKVTAAHGWRSLLLGMLATIVGAQAASAAEAEDRAPIAALREMMAAFPQGTADDRRAAGAAMAQAVRQLGDQALATLIEARVEGPPETRAWAADTLDALGKRTPGDMVQTGSELALVDVLRAYGVVRDTDALPVVLSFANADHAQVRAAARDSILSYGGRAPAKLREAYATVTGEQAVDDATSDVAAKLFAAYDRVRLQEVHALLDQGLASGREGKLTTAVAYFDQALARQPSLDRAAETVPVYLAYADSLEDADPVTAGAYLRRVLRLDPTGPLSSRAYSEIKYLEGRNLLAGGIDDVGPFEDAIAIDPNNSRARAELDRLHAKMARRSTRATRLAATAAFLALALPIIVMMIQRRREPA